MPCVWRWPGVIKPGQVINDICSLQDFIPTFAAAIGEPDLVDKEKKCYQIGEKTYKVHLDGVTSLNACRVYRTSAARPQRDGEEVLRYALLSFP